MNLAVPSWLYLRSSDNENYPKLDWSEWEDNMEKIVASTGSFGDCKPHDVVRIFRQICEKSMEEWTENDTMIIERAAPNLVFSCEVRHDAVFTQWRNEFSNEADLHCKPPRVPINANAEPAFVFSRKGELSSIEFYGRNGVRQSVNVANCRRKLQIALSRPTRGKGMGIVDRLPHLKSDPRDHVMANRMCYTFDVAEDWQKIRAAVRPQDLERSE